MALEDSPHNFQRSSKDENLCIFCQNVWPTLNNVVSSFQCCSLCGCSIHSNCKHLINFCPPCKNVAAPLTLSFQSCICGGAIRISVKHVYDIQVAEMSTVYGVLTVGNTSIRTKYLSTVKSECVWPEPEVLFIAKSDEQMKLCRFELWNSSFMELFDHVLYSCEVDLRPLFLHPNVTIDRWFHIFKRSSDESGSPLGKILIEFQYTLPLNKLPSISAHDEVLTLRSESLPNKLSGDADEDKERKRDELDQNFQISSDEKEEYHDGLPIEDNKVKNEIEDYQRTAQQLQDIVEAIEKVEKNKSSPFAYSKLESSGRISTFLADSVEKTVSTLGNLFYELETANLESNEESQLESKHEPQIEDLPPQAVEINAKDAMSVGKLKLNVINAFKYDVIDAAEGDHFITVEVDHETKFKSHVVKNSATPIFNSNVAISVPHFRSIVDVILHDAQSGNRLGSARITSYYIMQRKSDAKYWKSRGYVDNILPIFDLQGKREIGYFSGSFEFEEDIYSHYYSSAVRYSQNSPEEDLSVERLGIHISRFTELINFFSRCYQEYLQIMDWSDPILTFTLLLLFLYCTIQVNPDYTMSGVFFVIVLLMTRTYIRRRNGEYLRVYLSKGMKEVIPDYRPLAEVKIGVLAFRLRTKLSQSQSSFGFLVPSSIEEQHSRPPVLKVSYLPLRETDSGTEKEHLIGYLGVSDATIVNDSASGVSKFVNSFLNSETSKQYWQMTNVLDIWSHPVERAVLDTVGGIKGCVPAGSADCCLVYKVPQPIISKVLPHEKEIQIPRPEGTSGERGFSEKSDLSPDGGTSPFVPWNQNKSLIHLLLLREVGQSLITDKPEEQIKIQIRDILKYGKPNCADIKKATSFELVKWYKAQAKNEKATEKAKDLFEKSELSVDSYDYEQTIIDHSHSDSNEHISQPYYHQNSSSSNPFHHLATFAQNNGISSQHQLSSNSNTSLDSTEVLLRISINLPDERETFSPTEVEKTISQTLQTILSERINKDAGHQTFTVLWNMRDHVRYVQNLMNWLLDLLESFKNIFNWTIPEKTFPFYIGFIILWILTILIPGRILVLLVGLYEFLYVFLPIPDGNEISIRFMNLLNSIPNDDDLITIYSKEREQYHRKKKEFQQEFVEKILLNMSLHCFWSGGNVYMKCSASGSTSVHSSESEWILSFILLQGKRVLWWKQESAEKVDKVPTRPPKGQILLTPHSGFTQVSPVDLRVLTTIIPSVTEGRLISIFGQDPSGKPVKLTICFDSESTRRKIEDIASGILRK